jgi:TM2 domain-containing membrane protein YozV
MKHYLVVGTDGKRYGPADVPTLLRWIREGRLVAGTVLIDAQSGDQCSAASVCELRMAFFEASPPAMPATEPLDATRTAYRPAVPRPEPLTPLSVDVSSKSKVVAGLLGIFLGWCGAHRFYLGFPGVGIVMILSNVLCGFGAIWGFVEGILCLAGAMRDSEGRPLRD